MALLQTWLSLHSGRWLSLVAGEPPLPQGGSSWSSGNGTLIKYLPLAIQAKLAKQSTLPNSAWELALQVTIPSTLGLVNVLLTIIKSGSWGFTTMGTRTMGATGQSHKEQFWFCAKVACTAPNLVLKELQNYAWNTPEACVPGIRVFVLGEVDDVTRTRLGTGDNGVILVQQ
jgi:hypothetical protein